MRATGLAVLLVILGTALAWVNWDWLGEQTPKTASNGENARNVGFLVAGALALVFAVWRAIVAERQSAASADQAGTARTVLVNERYQRGAEMLGHGVLAVRMGGIYALQSLAEEYPDQYHVQIMKLLCAFVRNPTPDQENLRRETRDPSFDISLIPEDVQTAISIVGSRSSNLEGLEREAGFRLDLRGAILRFADLRSHNFVGADFSNAILRDANLDDANLTHAVLLNTNLSAANAVRTKFSYARCTWADCSAIDGRSSQFLGACLEGTDFSGAALYNAVFRGARFKGTLLGGAELGGADISNTHFTLGRQTSGVPPRNLVVGPPILTQDQLDETFASEGEPPVIDQEIFDDETGEPLVFRYGVNP